MVKKLSITPDKRIILTEGQTLQLKVSVSPASASEKSVTWKSSNPSVASVNSNGKITANGRGKSVISASANDGSNRKAQITVTVDPKVPAELNYVSWTNEDMGIIHVFLGYKNVSVSQKIDSVNVHVELYDVYGDLIDSGECALDARVVGPGKTEKNTNRYWIFHGSSRVRSAKIYISAIHTTSGKIYRYSFHETGATWQ